MSSLEQALAAKHPRQLIRDVMSTRLRAMAVLQLELAANIARSDAGNPLTDHFQQSAELLLEASKELRK